MAGRDFSDSIKLEVIKANLEKNDGCIRCETCKRIMKSISECHFDHIFPYSKGGKSTADNCQILCANCNLSKNSKLLETFVLEEKAMAFLKGQDITTNSDISCREEDIVIPNRADNKVEKMTKKRFDLIVGEFIKQKGDIRQIDFAREYNHLPSLHYVRDYYGTLSNLKKCFGIEDPSLNWNRDNIKSSLEKWVANHGDVIQKDLKKENGLPSQDCILRYYPEYNGLTDVKKHLLNLNVKNQWDKDSILKAGKEYIKNHDSITQKDFKAENGLPTYGIMKQYFGDINSYQEAIGAPLSKRNDFVSKEEISKEVQLFFEGKERIIYNQQEFSKIFKYNADLIRKRYGTFENFCKEENIIVSNPKKGKYSKRDVDDAISNWIKAGKPVPRAHDLSKQGLPSASSIMKFYEDWREPFEIYKKLHEEMSRFSND